MYIMWLYYGARWAAIVAFWGEFLCFDCYLAGSLEHVESIYRQVYSEM
jgi:hypothetical protein